MDQTAQAPSMQQMYSPMQQQNGIFTEQVTFAIKMAIVLMIMFLILRRKKRDLKKMQIKSSYIVPVDKIIIAIQIKDFFFHLEHRHQPGFEIIERNITERNILWKSLSHLLGFKECFKLIFSLRQITNFIRGLKNTANVQLMIYTSICPDLADVILRKLKLSEYFPIQNRKFCNPKQVDMMKHAIQVDKDSRRVIIVTPNKKDHNWEDQKYFLVINPKGGRNRNFLKYSLRMIKSLVEESEGLDAIHEDLAQLKIDVEDSDISDVSDIQRQIN